MLGFITIQDGSGAADRFLAETADALQAQGLRLAGAVRSDLDRIGMQDCDMELRVLGDGARIRISQDLGSGAQACRLDPGALASAAGRAEAVLAQGADLVIVNKFGKQEGLGQGFRAVIAAAVAQGVPVLTTVAPEHLPAFRDFAGDMAEPVPAEAALDWCRAQALPAR
ncbi:DUF2478 domain-containing protein [Paracoccus sp. (in: a-proteobacteria)]|uniref:DUF2478 domain-containing protein n=1 Tax=Paracoccus sp. TaxID=267 RepID=UPI0032208B31